MYDVSIVDTGSAGCVMAAVMVSSSSPSQVL